MFKKQRIHGYFGDYQLPAPSITSNCYRNKANVATDMLKVFNHVILKQKNADAGASFSVLPTFLCRETKEKQITQLHFLLPCSISINSFDIDDYSLTKVITLLVEKSGLKRYKYLYDYLDVDQLTAKPNILKKIGLVDKPSSMFATIRHSLFIHFSFENVDEPFPQEKDRLSDFIVDAFPNLCVPDDEFLTQYIINVYQNATPFLFPSLPAMFIRTPARQEDPASAYFVVPHDQDVILPDESLHLKEMIKQCTKHYIDREPFSFNFKWFNFAEQPPSSVKRAAIAENIGEVTMLYAILEVQYYFHCSSYFDHFLDDKTIYDLHYDEEKRKLAFQCKENSHVNQTELLQRIRLLYAQSNNTKLQHIKIVRNSDYRKLYTTPKKNIVPVLNQTYVVSRLEILLPLYCKTEIVYINPPAFTITNPSDPSQASSSTDQEPIPIHRCLKRSTQQQEEVQSLEEEEQKEEVKEEEEEQKEEELMPFQIPRRFGGYFNTTSDD